MTTQIKLKKSSVSGNIPDSGDLQYGELAINFADGKLFYKNSSNEIKAFIDSAAVQSLITTYQGLDSAGVTNLVDSAYIQARQTDVGLDSAGVTNLVDSAYVSARASFDSASVTTLVDSAYVQARQIGAGFALYEYNATDGQSTFEDSDLNGDILSYDENNIMVHYNGILLSKTEYTATDGTSVVLDDPADSGSIIMIAKWLEGGQDTLASTLEPSWYGDRAVFAGGVYSGSSRTNVMDYFDITTAGNATDFGDIPGSYSHLSGASDATYGVYIGSYTGSAASTDMYYITFSTAANATDFGDVTLNYVWPHVGNVSDGTYGLYAGGQDYATSTLRNNIEYFTISSPANAADFGDMTMGKRRGACFSDATYGVFGGGLYGGGTTNVIDYVTIASPGNATDFGDLTVTTQAFAGASDDTRGLFIGGIDGGSNNTISYVTIATPGNATDFGDLSSGQYQHASTSNSTRAVSGGGYIGSLSNTVQYVTIQTTSNSSDFGDLTLARSDLGALSGNAS